MEKKKRYFIYQTTNLVNGKIYIGKHGTFDIEDRYFGSGPVLRRAIKKYGIENFEFKVLIELQNEEELRLLESMVVNEDFINRPDVYNCMIGGQGGDTWSRLDHGHSDETKKKLSERSKAAQQRPEVRQKISYAQKEAWKRIKANKEFYDDIQRRRSESAKLACKNRKPRFWSNDDRKKLSRSMTAYYDKVGRKHPRRIQQPYRIEGLTSKPSVYVTDGQHEFRIRKEEVDIYIQHGYKLGRNLNNRKSLARNQAMKDNSSGKGKVVVYNETLQQQRRIDPVELNNYLSDGWKRGYLYKKDDVLRYKEAQGKDVC